MDAEQLELVCFSIITAAGTAKSNYIQAVEEARAGRYEEAEELIEQGDRYLSEGHAPHSAMVQQEAAGQHTEVSILLVHAEDQMASTEVFKVMAQQFIAICRDRDDLRSQVVALAARQPAAAEG